MTQSPGIEMQQPRGEEVAGHSHEGFDPFYRHIAYRPELARFRRLAAFWAKKLHDDTSVFGSRCDELNQLLRDCPELNGKTVLDCPYWMAERDCPEDRWEDIRVAWKAYEEALIKYGETLLMSQKIMNLPIQEDYHTKLLPIFDRPLCSPIFDQGRFIPTQEAASRYQGRGGSTTDTCAWRTMPSKDRLTLSLAKFSPWVEKHIFARMRKWWCDSKTSGSDDFSNVQYDTLITLLDWLSCLLASGSLAATAFALSYVPHRLPRLGAIAGLGLLFTFLMMVMVGGVKRGEVFLATAAFYAVAVVFVSNDNSCICNQ